MEHQYKYRLVEPDKDQPYKDALIEKSGIRATFTIAEVDLMQQRNRKMRRELAGQLEVEKAKMANLEHFHPEVLKLSKELLVAAALYQDADRMIREIEPKIASIDAAIAENDEMVDTVVQQMGFVPSEITPKLADDGEPNSEAQEG